MSAAPSRWVKTHVQAYDFNVFEMPRWVFPGARHWRAESRQIGTFPGKNGKNGKKTKKL
jgi:hypothetical protein